MSKYQREELRIMLQFLFTLCLVAVYSHFLSVSLSEFAWYALIGSSIGLSIIIYFWSKNRYLPFIIALLLCTAVYSVIYSWTIIFSLH